MKEQKNENLSAYEKAAQEGIDPRCIPQWLDGPVPEHDQIKYPDYPKTDQETWKFLYKRQMKEGRLSEKGGAGLGFIDIKRKTNKELEYHFLPISDDTSFFLLTSTISRSDN